MSKKSEREKLEKLALIVRLSLNTFKQDLPASLNEKFKEELQSDDIEIRERIRGYMDAMESVAEGIVMGMSAEFLSNAIDKIMNED